MQKYNRALHIRQTTFIDLHLVVPIFLNISSDVIFANRFETFSI